MKIGAELETERLIIRHWTLSDEDRAFFHFINSDPTVRRFYVTRMARELADERLEEIVAKTDPDSIKWAVACRKSDGRPIGFTGLDTVTYDTPFTPCVEIGWLYHPDCWGQGYASEAGSELLRHGFQDIGLHKIVAFAVHNNLPSIAVMERIGLNRVMGGDFTHPKVPQSHAHLQHHVLYELTSEQWTGQARRV